VSRHRRNVYWDGAKAVERDDRGAPPHGARREWKLRHLVLPVIWANSPVAIFHLED